MAYQSFKTEISGDKTTATVTAPAGTETVTATVGVGGIAIIIEDTAALNRNDVVSRLDQMRDLFMERNKDK